MTAIRTKTRPPSEDQRRIEDRPSPWVTYDSTAAGFVFTSQSNASLLAAVAAGFGVMAVPRGRAVRNNLVIWEDSPLPKLPEFYCALLVREGGDRTAFEELADYLEDQIRVEPNSLGFVGAPPVAGADRA